MKPTDPPADADSSRREQGAFEEPATADSRGERAGFLDEEGPRDAPRLAALAELSAAVAGIQERVRRDVDSSSDPGIPIPDLMPLLEARDAAYGKVAAIGSVNPRPPGGFNGLIQAVKRTVARLLDWHVREQVEFNRATLAGLESTLEALNEVNQSLKAVGRRSAAALSRTADYDDLKSGWDLRIRELDAKLAAVEIRLLRSFSTLQPAIEQRFQLLEGDLRRWLEGEMSRHCAASEQGMAQGREAMVQRLEEGLRTIQGQTGRDVAAFQERTWSEWARGRRELEALIHNELRTLRQRLALIPALTHGAPADGPATPAEPHAQPSPYDALHFAGRFRGSEDDIRERFRFYLPHFSGCARILDLGCGRGEFLEVLREAGLSGAGVDASAECAALCQEKGLTVQQADLFEYLAALPDGELDGLFCAQVIEHLPPLRIPELVTLCARKMRPGGLLVFETPNPECLAIFATHFYLDPTHVRPVPAQLLAYYLQEAGFGEIKVSELSPAESCLAGVAALPEATRRELFGGLDYAIFARRIS